jgi:hypothetical protein
MWPMLLDVLALTGVTTGLGLLSFRYWKRRRQAMRRAVGRPFEVPVTALDKSSWSRRKRKDRSP